MFNDVKLVFDYALSLIGDIWQLCMSTILVFSIALWVIALVIKIFKRIF